MYHFENFIRMSRQEQRIRLDGKLPSLEGFWSYRLGSSAVHVTLAVNELSLKIFIVVQAQRFARMKVRN